MTLKHCFPAALLFISAIASSQKKDSVTSERIKDILKINLASLPLKNVSLQYEYVFSKKISLALGARIMHSTAIPFQNLLINTIAEDNEDAQNIIRISRIGNVAITPEMRFYLGKGYGKGFYVAPYYRFAYFTSNTFIVNYSEPGGARKSVTLNGELNAHTGGLMLGAQWFLGKHVALDWWIAGAHYGTGKGRFIGRPSTPFTEGEQDDVKQTFDDIDIPFINKTITTTANNVTVNTSGTFAGLRAGIVVGVRF